MFGRAAFFIVFVVTCLTLPVGFKYFTCGFKVAKMEIDYPYQPELDVDPNVAPEIYAILNQPFHYLDKGSQSFVFVSQDGAYVLKFFRYHHKANRLYEKLVRLLQGARIASQLAKEETGLVYTHLNLTEGQLPIVHLKDPLRRSVKLPLDRYRFVLQKKGISLEEAFAQGSPEVCIDSFLTLVDRRLSKGIGNSDPNVSRNFGFLDGRAIEFDFGNYSLSPDLMIPEHKERERKRYADKLRIWLLKHAPESVAYLEKSR